MRKKICPVILLFFLTLAFSISLPTHAQAENSIQVFVEEQRVGFDVHPFIENGRTLIPTRGIMEALHADVTWDAARKTVSITGAGQDILLSIGSRQALVNGQISFLDIPPRIVDSRTMVPLRFISENLGFEVSWQEASRSVFISSPVPLKEAGIYNVQLGEKEEQVLQALGKADRIDPDRHGYNWWIYNKDPGNYLQVAIKNNRVAAIYSNGRNWQWQDISRGTNHATLTGISPPRRTISLNYDGADFTITLTEKDLQEKNLLLLKNAVVTFYLDVHDSSRVTGVLFADYETFLKRGGFNIHYSYYNGYPPDLSLPRLTASQKKEAAAAAEKQVFDLTNSTRFLHGLPPLTWHEKAASVARSHSQEMITYQYFGHISPVTGKSPFQRLTAAGLSYSYAGENLAAGHPDSFSALEALMNSEGHRQAILNKNFSHLGVGVVEKHYTQNFLTPR